MDIYNQFFDKISVPLICFSNKIFRRLALSKRNNFHVLYFERLVRYECWWELKNAENPAIRHLEVYSACTSRQGTYEISHTRERTHTHTRS